MIKKLVLAVSWTSSAVLSKQNSTRGSGRMPYSDTTPKILSVVPISTFKVNKFNFIEMQRMKNAN